jgi:hypothetical protein
MIYGINTCHKIQSSKIFCQIFTVQYSIRAENDYYYYYYYFIFQPKKTHQAIESDCVWRAVYCIVVHYLG